VTLKYVSKTLDVPSVGSIFLLQYTRAVPSISWRGGDFDRADRPFRAPPSRLSRPAGRPRQTRLAVCRRVLGGSGEGVMAKCLCSSIMQHWNVNFKVIRRHWSQTCDWFWLNNYFLLNHSYFTWIIHESIHLLMNDSMNYWLKSFIQRKWGDWIIQSTMNHSFRGDYTSLGAVCHSRPPGSKDYAVPGRDQIPGSVFGIQAHVWSCAWIPGSSWNPDICVMCLVIHKGHNIPVHNKPKDP